MTTHVVGPYPILTNTGVVLQPGATITPRDVRPLARPIGRRQHSLGRRKRDGSFELAALVAAGRVLEVAP